MAIRISKKEKDYILNSIPLLRPPKKYGVNVIWSGLKESFEFDFEKPFDPVIEELARRKIILTHDNKARKGGIVIYNPDDLPKSFATRRRNAQMRMRGKT